MFGGLILQGQAQFELINTGRSLLAAGDYRAAHAVFQAVVAGHPEDDTGRFFLAVTTLVSTIDNPRVQSTMDAFGVSATGRDPFNWQAQIPTSGTGWPIPPNGWTSEDLLKLLRNDVRQSLQKAGEHLSEIQDPNFFLFLTAEETGLQSVIVDWGDVGVILSIVHLTEAIIWTLDNYDLQASLTQLFTMQEDQSISIEKVLKAFPNLLKSSSEQHFSSATTSLRKAVSTFQQASPFIRKRTAGAERLFTVYPKDQQALNDLDATAAEVLLSLDGTPVRPALLRDEEIAVSLNHFYSPPFVPRQLLPRFNGNLIVKNTFPDPGFGKTLTGIEQDDLERIFGFPVEPSIYPIGSVPQEFDFILRPGNGQIVVGWLNHETFRYEVYTRERLDQGAWRKVDVIEASSEPIQSYTIPSGDHLPSAFYHVVKIPMSGESGQGGGGVTNPTEDPMTIPELDMEMMPIPAGTFVMGSASDEKDRYDDEGPQTTVTLTKPFWLGKTEVTQGQWKAVMGNTPSRFTGDDLPVERVTWFDAVAFCEKLNEMKRDTLPAGYHYTLPTEAQWEYACRAGTTTRFYYGDDPGYNQLGQYAWYDDNSSSKTHAVGEKLPNDWGLHDMHGNVFEWCLDWNGDYTGGSVSDPQGPPSGWNRVPRGGGWNDVARLCRSACRGWFWPDDSADFLGFRVALSSVPSE